MQAHNHRLMTRHDSIITDESSKIKADKRIFRVNSSFKMNKEAHIYIYTYIYIYTVNIIYGTSVMSVQAHNISSDIRMQPNP